MNTNAPDYKRTLHACYIGYVTQAIVNNLAPLLFLRFQAEFGIPLSRITLLVTLNFSIQLIIDLLSARFADTIGYKRCAAAADICAAAGLAGLAVLPGVLPDPYTGIVISVMLYAVGGGLMEVLLSPIVEACPFDNKAGIMSVLHAFYCIGSACVILGSTVFTAVFGLDHWRIMALLWAVIPLANLLMFSQAPMPALVPEGQGLSVRELLKSRVIWLLFILMICSGASEQAMSQWASAFAEAGLGISKTLGDLAGPFMFAVLMGTSRLIYGKFVNEKNITVFMAGSSVLCVASYLLAALSSNPAAGLIGCALCGFFVGVLWPGVFSLASSCCPLGGTAMFALLALGGDLGCSSGPTLVGIVSDITESFNKGLLAGMVFPVIMLAGLFCLRKTVNAHPLGLRQRQG